MQPFPFIQNQHQEYTGLNETSCSAKVFCLKTHLCILLASRLEAEKKRRKIAEEQLDKIIKVICNLQ